MSFRGSTMFPHHFSMTFLRFLLASWSIYMLIQETISLQEVLLHKFSYRTPLAVIRKRDSSLHLAIPHHHEYEDKERYAAYNYDDSIDENEPKEKLLVACPASDNEKQLDAEKNWKKTGVTSSASRLFFLCEPSILNHDCSEKLVPSINKVVRGNGEDHAEHCSQLKAEMYEVGYPVSNDDEGKDIQFISLYKICYSKVKGKEATLYSIHRIQSPSLLFMDELKELPDDRPLLSHNHHDSFLDSSLSTKQSFEGMVYFKHQFVGSNDMGSIRPWEQTTFFLFNYTPITRNEDVYKGMIRAEWYIRLLSKKKNKPFTLYTGIHKQIIGNRVIHWIKEKARLAKPVDLFWRIILDDEGYAIILIIQHNFTNCGPVYLCRKPRQIKTYEKGGCIYTCSLTENDDLFGLLGAPLLKITGDLDFTIQPDDTEKMSRPYDIIDFLNNTSFVEALRNIDKNILQNVDFSAA